MSPASQLPNTLNTPASTNVPVRNSSFDSESRVPDEFQVILLAGQGKALYPLSGDDNLPKALLPIGNRPMIAHVLDWLEKARIRHVTVVSNGSSAEKITHYLRNVYEGEVNAIVKIHEVGDGPITGTADVLRSLSNIITNNFIVLSCDTITDLLPHSFLDFYRLYDDSAATALLYDSSKVEGGIHGTKDEKEEKAEGEVVGMSMAQHQLVYVQSLSAMDDLEMRVSLLNHFPKISMFTNLQDGHIYIFKHWVLDFLVDNPHISSIKEDLLPILVKLQYRKSLMKRYNIEKYSLKDALQQMALNSSSTYAPNTKSSVSSPIIVRAFVYSTGYCTRANTVPRYAAINRHISKMPSPDVRVASTATVSSKSQVGTDSLVGESSRIDEKSSIKRSAIGAHCVIGKFVKISNCILMDHVIIEDGVKLDGCILCVGSKVEEKASLKDCEVGPKFVVEKGRDTEGEQLTVEIDFV